VSGFSRTVRIDEGREDVSLRAPFRQAGTTPLRFDPDAGRGGHTNSNIAPINDRHPGYPNACVTFDQTAAKSLATRRVS
jgi:hypothetical protein